MRYSPGLIAEDTVSLGVPRPSKTHGVQRGLAPRDKKVRLLDDQGRDHEQRDEPHRQIKTSMELR